MKARNVMTFVICLLIGLLWLYAGLQKISDLPNFRNQMSKSPMLTAIAPVLTYAIPLTELALVYLLIYKKTRLFALYASLFLLVQFTTYLFLILNYSFYVPCACGGIIGGLSWNAHIIVNIGLSAVTIVGIVLQSISKTVEKPAKVADEHLIWKYT